MTLRQVFEARVFADERQLHHAYGTVALLADDDLRDALRIRRRRILILIDIVAIDEGDDVGVLLEGAGLSKVGELWPVVSARLGRAAELRQHDDRDAQLFREALQ